MSTSLVVGGSGRTGRRVVERLLAARRPVAVLSRRPRPAAGVRTIVGDLGDLATWPTALADVEGVVVCVEPPYDAAGAETVMSRGIAALAVAAAERDLRVVLVSQIYVTRPQAHPAMAHVTEARARGEQALRASGADHAVVRPGWLTDEPATGVRLEQGDTGDGTTSRDTVADACVHLLLRPGGAPVTFEVFDDPAAGPADWTAALAALTPDPVAGPR
ncbi:NAD(P)-binding oxidoreductase [Geodermatophilus sp. SYSU D00814]